MATSRSTTEQKELDQIAPETKETKNATGMTKEDADKVKIPKKKVDIDDLTERMAKLQAAGKKFVEVKKFNAVALWSWDVNIDNCAICRNHLMDQCIECQATQNSEVSEECTCAWGSCNHAYHYHCMSKWLKNRNVCPLCNREWELLKLGNQKE